MKNNFSIIGLKQKHGPAFFEDELSKKIASLQVMIGDEQTQFLLNQNDCHTMISYLSYLLNQEWERPTTGHDPVGNF